MLPLLEYTLGLLTSYDNTTTAIEIATRGKIYRLFGRSAQNSWQKSNASPIFDHPLNIPDLELYLPFTVSVPVSRADPEFYHTHKCQIQSFVFADSSGFP
jgi:hypothetical protein